MANLSVSFLFLIHPSARMCACVLISVTEYSLCVCVCVYMTVHACSLYLSIAAYSMCWRVLVCMHVFAVWLYKTEEWRELSEVVALVSSARGLCRR